MTKKSLVSEDLNELKALLRSAPPIVNGSVFKQPPASPTANPTYAWTRKVKAKTVTKALSKVQYEAFQEAIITNRKIEQCLASIRKNSEKEMLENIEGVRGRGKHERRKKDPQKSS